MLIVTLTVIVSIDIECDKTYGIVFNVYSPVTKIKLRTLVKLSLTQIT